jgi:hypothetical protein
MRAERACDDKCDADTNIDGLQARRYGESDSHNALATVGGARFMAEQRSVEYVGQREFKKHRENWVRQGWHVVTVTQAKFRAEALPLVAGVAIVPRPLPRFHVIYERP